MIELICLKELMLTKPMFSVNVNKTNVLYYLSLLVLSRDTFYIIAKSVRWLSLFNAKSYEF